jgi:hypothetical protein
VATLRTTSFTFKNSTFYTQGAVPDPLMSLLLGGCGGGGCGDDEEDMSNRCYMKEPTVLKSDHLMFTWSPTLAYCSLLWHLRRSRMNKAFFVSFFHQVLPDIRSETGVVCLLSHCWMAKMHRAAANNCRETESEGWISRVSITAVDYLMQNAIKNIYRFK